MGSNQVPFPAPPPAVGHFGDDLNTALDLVQHHGLERTLVFRDILRDYTRNQIIELQRVFRYYTETQIRDLWTQRERARSLNAFHYPRPISRPISDFSTTSTLNDDRWSYHSNNAQLSYAERMAGQHPHPNSATLVTSFEKGFRVTSPVSDSWLDGQVLNSGQHNYGSSQPKVLPDANFSEKLFTANPSEPHFKRYPGTPPKSLPKYIPCSELDCNENFSRELNFKQHYMPRHRMGNKYECKPVTGKPCSSVTYAEPDWKKHHQWCHPDCKNDEVQCRVMTRGERLWACPVDICEPFTFTSLDDFAKHYVTHFSKNGLTKLPRINISNVIHGLLEQEITKKVWHEQRANCLGKDWKKTIWNSDISEVRSLVVDLEGACSQAQVLGDDDNARFLVNLAINLATKPLIGSCGPAPTPLKRRATSSPSKSDRSSKTKQNSNDVHESHYSPNDDWQCDIDAAIGPTTINEDANRQHTQHGTPLDILDRFPFQTYQGKMS